MRVKFNISIWATIISVLVFLWAVVAISFTVIFVVRWLSQLTTIIQNEFMADPLTAGVVYGCFFTFVVGIALLSARDAWRSINAGGFIRKVGNSRD